MEKVERECSLTDEDKRLVFERRVRIFLRIHERREENKKLGLEPTISDTWTPEQRETFLRDWLDDSDIMEASRGEKRTYDEIMNEEPSTLHQLNCNEGALQTGRGQNTAVARTLIGGVFIHLFMFCPTSFF